MVFLLLRSIVSTGFKSEQESVGSLKLGFERWIEFGFDCTVVKQSAKISSVLTWTSLTCGRAHNCCKTNAFYLFRLIMLTAAQESQHWICRDVYSALFADFRNQFRCCRRPMPSQAPDSAATNSASPLLSAIVDCFLLVAVIGYQPNLPYTHDAVPLTLDRSASPARSASPYVNTEPSGARFTASKLKDIGCTFMIPGFPRRYRKIDLMFLMSVSLARPRLDEAFPIAQRKPTWSIPETPSARLLVAPPHGSPGVPSTV